MDQKPIKTITDKHYRKLKKLIGQVAGKFDAEAIHQFRVEYKKLRAFFRLVSFEQVTGRGVRVTKKLKRAYHISGYIRDLQLQQQRIQAVTKQGSRYTRLLQEKMDKRKAELAAIILEKPVVKCKRKTDAAVPDEFQLSGLRSFTNNNWTAINGIIASGDLSDDHIHTIRKKLKDIFYDLKIYGGNDQGVLPQAGWKGKDESFFYRLMDQLGIFQDNCRAIVLLKPSWLEQSNPQQQAVLIKIKKRWLKDQLVMKRRIEKKLMAAVPSQLRLFRHCRKKKQLLITKRRLKTALVFIGKKHTSSDFLIKVTIAREGSHFSQKGPFLPCGYQLT